MVDRLRLSRAQIAAFVGNDPEAIRQIEKLFSTAVSQETGIDEVAVIAGTADSKAGQALAELQRIADALEVLALAPVGDDDAPIGDIAPSVVPATPMDPLTPPVVMAAATDWLLPPSEPVIPTSGWAVYNHGGGTQSLASSTRTQLSIDGATKIETELPPNSGPLWNTVSNAITGRYGDAIVVKVQCIVTPTTAAASEVLFEIDVAGGVGVVEYQTFILGKGSGNPHYISWTFLAYTLDTWAANGGKLYATADGPVNVTSLRILINRTHRGVV